MLLWDIEEWVTDACINAEPEQEQGMEQGRVSAEASMASIETKPVAGTTVRAGAAAASRENVPAARAQSGDAVMAAVTTTDRRLEL